MHMIYKVFENNENSKKIDGKEKFFCLDQWENYFPRRGSMQEKVRNPGLGFELNLWMCFFGY